MRIDLRHSHGSPSLYHYNKGCRCMCCKGAKSAADAAYRAENADRLRVSKAAYYREHREQAAAYNAVYRAEHHDELQAKRRAAYQPGQRAAYYQANREKLLAYSIAWGAEHPDERATAVRQRRARLRGAKGTHTAADTRAQYERQRGRCYWCNAKVPWSKKHVDHVVPLSLGGSNGPENLVISCAPCNLAKHATHPMDYAGRML